jgi:hypothetical protein
MVDERTLTRRLLGGSYREVDDGGEQQTPSGSSTPGRKVTISTLSSTKTIGNSTVSEGGGRGRMGERERERGEGGRRERKREHVHIRICTHFSWLAPISWNFQGEIHVHVGLTCIVNELDFEIILGW